MLFNRLLLAKHSMEVVPRMEKEAHRSMLKKETKTTTISSSSYSKIIAPKVDLKIEEPSWWKIMGMKMEPSRTNTGKTTQLSSIGQKCCEWTQSSVRLNPHQIVSVSQTKRLNYLECIATLMFSTPITITWCRLATQTTTLRTSLINSNLRTTSKIWTNQPPMQTQGLSRPKEVQAQWNDRVNRAAPWHLQSSELASTIKAKDNKALITRDSPIWQTSR